MCNKEKLKKLVDEMGSEVLESLSPKLLDRLAEATGQSTGELLGGLKGSCPGCPMNEGMTKHATDGQNYGCLPSQGEIVHMKRVTGHNWACHDDENSVCAGLCHVAKEESLDLRTGGLISYTTWYHEGQEVAIAEAAKNAALRGGGR